MNLGAVLAATGKKIVVVDGDLRRGHLQKYIGQGAAPGLSDYVVGNADIDSIVRKTGIAGLHVVPNGTTPPNPAELLMHARFEQLLKRSEEHTSELQSLMRISYAVFCLKKKTKNKDIVKA